MFDCSKVTHVSQDCECHCEEGGWCEPHQIIKTKHYVYLCKTNSKYRLAWNNCCGPRQTHYATVKQGPGSALQKMLGCDFQRNNGCVWKSRYHKMNVWNDDCKNHITDICKWLVDANIQKDIALRLVNSVVK